MAVTLHCSAALLGPRPPRPQGRPAAGGLGSAACPPPASIECHFLLVCRSPSLVGRLRKPFCLRKRLDGAGCSGHSRPSPRRPDASAPSLRLLPVWPAAPEPLAGSLGTAWAGRTFPAAGGLQPSSGASGPMPLVCLVCLAARGPLTRGVVRLARARGHGG